MGVGESTRFNALAEAALRVPGVCAWLWQVETDELSWSDALIELYGFETAPRDLDQFLAAIVPEDRTRVAAETRSYIEAGDRFDHEFRIVRPDGEVRWILDRGLITRDDSGRALRIDGINIDITELRKAEEQVHSAERRAAVAAQIGGLVSWEVDATTGEIIAEAGLPKLFGLDCNVAPEVMGAYVDCIHEQDVGPTLAEFAKAQVPGGRYSADFRVTVDGTTRWLRGCGMGTLVQGRCRVVGFNVDVTSEYEARARLDLVNHELKHRVKNLLTLVQALAHQNFRSSEDKPALRAFEGRLNALAASTDLLFRNDWQALALEDLIRIALSGPSGSLDRVRSSGPDVKVYPGAVFPLLLTFHELATNAVKYGGLSRSGGGVEVAWTWAENSLTVRWKERSQVTAAEPLSGFGTKLLKRVIGGELKGSFDRTLEPGGLNCTLEIPATCFQSGPTN